jgi:hypothetical protein
MLSLDSPRWSELWHAYGAATDIPDLLRQLEFFPPSNDKEPWYPLWSALAHQGDVYPASFAAVPHVVHAFASDPCRANSSYFNFPGWVEICRKKKGISVPNDLHHDYFAALARLPLLIASAAAREWSSDDLCCALSTIAAVKGDAGVAEAALELTPEVAQRFMRWIFEE